MRVISFRFEDGGFIRKLMLINICLKITYIRLCSRQEFNGMITLLTAGVFASNGIFLVSVMKEDCQICKMNLYYRKHNNTLAIHTNSFFYILDKAKIQLYQWRKNNFPGEGISNSRNTQKANTQRLFQFLSNARLT